MRLINSISYKLAKALSDKLYWSNKTKRVFYYNIRFILGTIVKMLVVFAIAKLLDVVKPTLYCAVAYGITKVLSGGMHHRSLGRSVLLSVMLFFTMGVIADIFYFLFNPVDDILTKGPFIYVWLFFVCSAFITVFFVPIQVRHKIFFKKAGKYIYKLLTLAFIAVTMHYTIKILNMEDTVRLIDIELPKALAIWTGIGFELFTSVPIVYKAASKLNQILNYK